MALTFQNSSSNIFATATAKHTFTNFKSLSDARWYGRFSPLHFHSYHFNFGIYPKHESFNNEVFFQLQINEKLEKLNIEYEIAILNVKNEKCYTRCYLWNYAKNVDHYRKSQSFISYDYLVDEENGLIPNNSLTLLCEVNILKGNPSTVMIPGLILPVNNILQNYQSLLENGKFSDVVLVLGKCEIKAHRNILSAQSQVFSAMFDHSETKEAMEGRVEIIDMTAEVCHELLRYVYSGKIPEKEFVLNLFVAADKYELEDLKLICEKLLASSLSTESVVNTFLMADMHSSTELKAKCIEFITENSVKVMKTDGWKQFLKTRVELVVDLFQNLSTKYVNTK